MPRNKNKQTFLERLPDLLSLTSLKFEDLPSEKEVVKGLFLEVYKTYRRNLFVESRWQRLYATDNKNAQVTQMLATVQQELRQNEEYLEMMAFKL